MSVWDYIGMFVVVQLSVLVAAFVGKGEATGLLRAWGTMLRSLAILLDDDPESWLVKKDQRERLATEAHEVVVAFLFVVSVAWYFWSPVEEGRLLVAGGWYTLFVYFLLGTGPMFRPTVGLVAAPVIVIATCALPLTYLSAPMERVWIPVAWYVLVMVVVVWKDLYSMMISDGTLVVEE